MQQLNATQIKKSFINTSRREVEKIALPPNLAEIEWAELDYFGWADAKIPQRAYIVVPVDDVPRGLMLRAVPMAKSQAMCSWCEDLHETTGVRMFTAKKAGHSGRNGNSLGTLIHGNFECSEIVRNPPRAVEGHNDFEAHVSMRVEKLNERATSFVKRVLGEK